VQYSWGLIKGFEWMSVATENKLWEKQKQGRTNTNKLSKKKKQVTNMWDRGEKIQQKFGE